MFGHQNISGISVPPKGSAPGWASQGRLGAGAQKKDVRVRRSRPGCDKGRFHQPRPGTTRARKTRPDARNMVIQAHAQPRPKDTDRGGTVHGRRGVFFCPCCLKNQTIGLEQEQGQGRNRPNPGSIQSAFGDTRSGLVRPLPMRGPGQPRDRNPERKGLSMLELGIVLLIVALAVFFLTRRYLGAARQGRQPNGGCGCGCGCCQSSAGIQGEGCATTPSPNNDLERSN